MSQDHYQKGKELTKSGIYQILAEEAWRDGDLSRADSELLEGLRKYLRLKNDAAMKILDIAEEKYRNQTLGRLRDFSPRQCYARALRYAYSDEVKLSSREEKFLRGLRSALGLKDGDHDEIRRKLEEKGWSPGPGAKGEGAAFDQAAIDKMRLMAGTSQGGADPSLFTELSASASAPGAVTPETDAQPAVNKEDVEKPTLSPQAAMPPAQELEAPPAEPEPPPPEPEPPAPEPEPPPPEPEAPPPDDEAARKAAKEEKRKRRKKRRKRKKEKEAAAAAEAEAGDAPAEAAEAVEKAAETAKAAEKVSSKAREKIKKRRKKRKEEKSAVPTDTGGSAPNPLENLPPTVRIVLLTACIMGVVLLVVPRFMGGGEVILDDDGDTGSSGGGRYAQLEEQFGTSNFKVKQLVVRGPDPPNGPPLDLGEAWDLYAGRDGKLYGTAQYRIFQIDPKTGKAKWIAGSGQLGEPEEGRPALEVEMDPANPRVDSSGTVYFRHGSSVVYRIGKDGKLERVLGTRENRVVWKDGDPADKAKPGAIEQIALGQGGRIYFDEYSGEVKGPEILGRIEPGDKLRAMFLFALEPVDHPYRRLVKSFIGSGNGFENLEVGENGALYFTVGNRLYRWSPGQGPPVMLLPEAPLEFTVDADGGLIVVQENRIERWVDIEKWTRDQKFVEVIAGGNDEALASAEGEGVLPGKATGYMQPRDLTIGPKGTLYLLDGAAGGVGLSRPRIDMIKRVKPYQKPPPPGSSGDKADPQQ